MNLWDVLSTARIGADFSTRNRELISRRGGGGRGGGFVANASLNPFYKQVFSMGKIGYSDINLK